jgi:hypothetical protein
MPAPAGESNNLDADDPDDEAADVESFRRVVTARDIFGWPIDAVRVTDAECASHWDASAWHRSGAT